MALYGFNFAIMMVVAAAITIITVIIWSNRLGWRTYYEVNEGAWSKPYDLYKESDGNFYISGLKVRNLKEMRVSEKKVNKAGITETNYQEYRRVVPLGIFA